MAGDAGAYADRAYAHIHHLTERIGPRPSTGVGERDAADYAAHVLRRAGLHDVRLEPFESPRSTYAPYRRAFGAALLGTLAGRVLPGRAGLLLAAALNALGARGFLAEADLADNWTRRLVGYGSSQNVIGIIPARGQVRQRVVLYGHLDTHRTPSFYGSTTWLRLFAPLIGLSFLSMGLNALIYAAYALGGRSEDGGSRASILDPPSSIAGLVSLAATALQLFSLALITQADLTPYAPGANDNASGAATALALGERLARDPLDHTEVWIVNTGCEELGAHGIAALLDCHGERLRDALFLDFDMVGIGDPAVIPEQGLLRRRKADPRLLGAARAMAAAHPELRVWEHTTDAYDDSYMVARRGFRGMTIDAEGRPGTATAYEHKHWHRMSDTIDKIDRVALQRVHEFAWLLVRHLDGT